MPDDQLETSGIPDSYDYQAVFLAGSIQTSHAGMHLPGSSPEGEALPYAKSPDKFDTDDTAGACCKGVSPASDANCSQCCSPAPIPASGGFCCPGDPEHEHEHKHKRHKKHSSWYDRA